MTVTLSGSVGPSILGVRVVTGKNLAIGNTAVANNFGFVPFTGKQAGSLVYGAFAAYVNTISGLTWPWTMGGTLQNGIVLEGNASSFTTDFHGLLVPRPRPARQYR
jgi:hypothetical protein